MTPNSPSHVALPASLWTHGDLPCFTALSAVPSELQMSEKLLMELPRLLFLFLVFPCRCLNICRDESLSHFCVSLPSELRCTSCVHVCLHVRMYVYMCATCMPSACGRQKQHWTSWKWSYRCLWAVMWVLGTNMGPLQEQKMLLAAEPSLQTHDCLLLPLSSLVQGHRDDSAVRAPAALLEAWVQFPAPWWWLTITYKGIWGPNWFRHLFVSSFESLTILKLNVFISVCHFLLFDILRFSHRRVRNSWRSWMPFLFFHTSCVFSANICTSVATDLSSTFMWGSSQRAACSWGLNPQDALQRRKQGVLTIAQSKWDAEIEQKLVKGYCMAPATTERRSKAYREYTKV